MRILIDLLHPAHVHFFRNFHAEMRERGHDLCITARSKEMSIELLEHYGLPYHLVSEQRSGRLALMAEMAARTGRVLRIARKFRPDVMTGIMGPSIAVAGQLLRTPAVVFYDTEFAVQTNRFVYPLAHTVCTPDCYQGVVNGRHVTYPGYHELAYLHPTRFRADPARLEAFGIRPDEPYGIVRFVSWQAVHDRRERGLTASEKNRIVERLERHGRVLISSEGPLPATLRDRRVRGPVSDIHHLIAHARVVVGESATMSSEAAVLGVPAVLIAKTGRGYTDDLERRYGLVRHFTEDRLDDALRATDEFASSRGTAQIREAHRRLVAEKIDVTEWMVGFFLTQFGRADARPVSVRVEE